MVTSADHTRDLIFVDDAIDGVVAAAAAPELAGEVLNIGSGREYLVGEVASLIIERSGARIDLRCANAAGSTDVQRLVLDVTRARQLLGWETRTSLEDGLERTIGWYRQHRRT